MLEFERPDVAVLLSDRKTFQCRAVPENTFQPSTKGCLSRRLLFVSFFLFLPSFSLFFSFFSTDWVGLSSAWGAWWISFMCWDRYVLTHVDDQYNSQRIINWFIKYYANVLIKEVYGNVCINWGTRNLPSARNFTKRARTNSHERNIVYSEITRTVSYSLVNNALRTIYRGN